MILVISLSHPANVCPSTAGAVGATAACLYNVGTTAITLSSESTNVTLYELIVACGTNTTSSAGNV